MWHSYEWNEWALRRQALRIIQLRQSATTSVQTDNSHFRRDNDAQVYLPREAGTQTGISVGSNTTRVVRYFAGLRGTPDAVVEAATAAAMERGAMTASKGRPLIPAGGSSASTTVVNGSTGPAVPPGTHVATLSKGVTVMTMTLDV